MRIRGQVSGDASDNGELCGGIMMLDFVDGLLSKFRPSSFAGSCERPLTVQQGTQQGRMSATALQT